MSISLGNKFTYHLKVQVHVSSYKLPKYGESSAKAVLSHVHRAKAGSVVAKAPRKDLRKYHASTMNTSTLLNTAQIASKPYFLWLWRRNPVLEQALARRNCCPAGVIPLASATWCLQIAFGWLHQFCSALLPRAHFIVVTTFRLVAIMVLCIPVRTYTTLNNMT